MEIIQKCQWFYKKIACLCLGQHKIKLAIINIKVLRSLLMVIIRVKISVSKVHNYYINNKIC